MAQAASLAITVHDYMGMPEGPPYFELVEGELFMSPPPLRVHQEIARNIVGIILAYLEKRPIGKLFFAPFGVFLTEINAYQRDIVFVSNERKSALTDEGLSGAPDFVVEILSPSTSSLDKGAKKKIYARCGVTELWLIDPKLKMIAVYHLGESAETPAATYSGKARFESDIFPGLKFSCAKVFEE
jgi:Uma2 family endonuclease